MLGKLKVFVSGGVKIDAKKEDMLGNLKFFVQGVECWGWVVGGGRMHMMHRLCHGFLWVKIVAKKRDSSGKLKVFVF